MAALLALLLLLAPDSLEKRFVEALKSDLATGTTEKTAPFIAPAIRDKLTPARLEPVYEAWKSYGKVVSLKVDPTTPFGLERRVRFILEQERERTHVVCRFDANGQLTSYWFRPAPRRWDRRKIDEVTAKWSGDFGWCVATPEKTQSASRGDGPFPLGSIFKLYVLAELAAQIESGKVTPARKVKIREEYKSLPSGVTHTKPAGAEVTVRELATKMISISDNTATDHLLHLVGRENIENGLERWRNSCADRNRPFLTTREMFLIKGGGKESAIGLSFADLCARWPKQSRATRMEWVSKMCAPFAKTPLAELLQPIGTGYGIRSNAVPRHLTFEWFAEPADICALLLGMWAGKHPGSEHFLEYYKTGSEIYPREWVQYYGFKGGSETNVMAMCALAVGKDGRPVAVCACRRGDLNRAAAGDVAQLAGALLNAELEAKLGSERR